MVGNDEKDLEAFVPMFVRPGRVSLDLAAPSVPAACLVCFLEPNILREEKSNEGNIALELMFRAGDDKRGFFRGGELATSA